LATLRIKIHAETARRIVHGGEQQLKVRHAKSTGIYSLAPRDDSARQ
jgi:hypothetical protein